MIAPALVDTGGLGLWRARPYQHPVTGRRCEGKVHVLRQDDPRSRTLCGRSTADIGETPYSTADMNQLTCQGCRARRAARTRRETARAQFAELNAAIDRKNAQWWQRYDQYLRTPAWLWRRDKVLARANYRCEGCSVHPATQVHHLTYERVRREMLFDLVAVCDACHAAIHAAHQP